MRNKKMSSDPAATGFFENLKKHFAHEKEDSTLEKLGKEIEDLHQKTEINDTEYSMFSGLLNFQGKMAREVMVPRPDAFMVDINDSFQDNLDSILHEPYSRIPVYDQDKDKIVGVIHIRSVLRKAHKVGFENLNYQDVMYKPLFAPETIELSDLLVEMQKRQQQIAILTDEYGGVVGLATIEDLIEEIVGDIDDEVDTAEVLFTQLSENKYVIYGKMPLDDFNEEFDTDLEMEDVDTVAGYVITKLGMIPAKGEKLSVRLDNGMVLTTRRMKGSRILTLLLTIPDKKKEEIED
ncbi:hemolysin [Lactobacillus psittaci DSM 15354]|uniref:Hemolysin n=2 Tax=Lactobacillus psittaci TaxID=116089 RepID=A0A0R1S5G0_9LACO|nr:hemolysin [Lactobacillus psittaci DSM 15354]